MRTTRTMSVVLSWPFLRTFLELGVSPELLVGRERELYGLEPHEFVQPDTRLPLSVAFADVEGYMRRLQRPDLGLRAALAVRPGDFGPAELAARAFPDVRTALDVLLRGWPLLVDGVHLASELRDEVLCLRLWAEPGLTLPPWVSEFAFLALVRTTLAYVDAPAPPRPLCVRFAHPPVPYREAVSQAFGCEVEFGALENALDVPAAALALPMRTADVVAAAHMGAQLAHAVAAVGTRSLVERVEAAVTRQLAQGLPPVDVVAAELGTSARTLHRKLAEQGTSYRELSQACQRRLAVYYLQHTSMPIKEIAAALGFHNVPGFHRAFRRLTGQTPRACRDAPVAAASPPTRGGGA